MKPFVAHSLVLLGLFTSACVLPTVSGNFSDALTEFQGAEAKGTADASRARSAFLKERVPDGPITVSIFQAMVGAYYAEIGFGQPVLSSPLIVDTGSSITWCKDYVETTTTTRTENEFNIKYGGGRRHCEANVVIDQVSIGDNLVITNQKVGAAFSFSGFDGLLGIFGLGPVGLTRGTIVGADPFVTVPTVMNNLKSQALISHEVFSLYFPPTAYSGGRDEGKLTFGGVDESLYEGDIRFVPLTDVHPASLYWGVDLRSLWYGPHNFVLSPIAGTIDSGARLIFFAQDLFDAYRAAIPDTIYDTTLAHLIEIPSASIQYMLPLHFQFHDEMFTMEVEDQLLPQQVNEAFGGKPDKRYSVFCSIGPDTRSGTGNDFILGIPFMKVYYTVHDTENRRLGFAKAKPVASTG